jgi:hypothetical protein
VAVYRWRLFAILMTLFLAYLWGLPEPFSGPTDAAVTIISYLGSLLGLAGLYSYAFSYDLGSVRLWTTAKYLFAAFVLVLLGGAWYVGGTQDDLTVQILGTTLIAVMFSLNWLALHRLSLSR